MPVRGKGKCWFLKEASFKGVSFHFHGKSLFYVKDSFLRRRCISTSEAYFYGEGIFLRWRHISTAKVYFYGGGTFPRRRCISTAEAHFYAEVYFYEDSVISMKEVNLKAIGLSVTCMEKRNQCTAQLSFYVETALF